MLRKNWPALVALLAILMVLASTRGGLASLVPFARFLIPIAIIWIFFKWSKRALRDFVMRSIEKKMAGHESAFQEILRRTGGPFGPTRSPDQGVVDLCPKCGAQFGAKHRCS